MKVDFPDDFPSISELITVVKRTAEKSWNNDLDVIEVEKWLGNFIGSVYDVEDERRIALWLLCNFTYYNINDVNHLCKILYNYFLHDIASNNLFGREKSIIDLLSRAQFSPIGEASESGGLLLYHFRQAANLSIDKFFYPAALNPKEDSILIFIDDVTLSGSSAVRFFENNLSSMKCNKIYYLAMIASYDAICELAALGVKVITCVLVDDRDKMFSESSLAFLRYKKLLEPAKKIADEYGKSIEPNHSLGYKNGQYSFGFYYNTPNNTIPVFWSNNNWIPIFARKEKIYNARSIQPFSRRFI